MPQSGITLRISIQLSVELPDLKPEPQRWRPFLTLGNTISLCEYLNSALCFEAGSSEFLEYFLLVCSSLCFYSKILLFPKSIKKKKDNKCPGNQGACLLCSPQIFQHQAQPWSLVHAKQMFVK